MKKLVQSSLIALASSFIFSCSTGKYYQHAAKDSAYGFKAPKNEAVAVNGGFQEEASVPEDILLEASAADILVGKDTSPDAVPAVSPANAKVTAPRIQPALAVANPTAITETAASEAKPVLAKGDVKKLKKEIKDIKKTTQLDRNLKLGLIFVLAGVIAGIFSPLLGGILVLVGLVFGVLWLVNL